MTNQQSMAKALADARKPYADAIAARESELSALRAENQRLREALRGLLQAIPGSQAHAVQEGKARVALAGKGEA